MKKKQLKITIEQKQTWYVSRTTESSMSGHDADSVTDTWQPEQPADTDWQKEEIALLENTIGNIKIPAPKAQSQSWTRGLLTILMKPVNYVVQFLRRIRIEK